MRKPFIFVKQEDKHYGTRALRIGPVLYWSMCPRGEFGVSAIRTLNVGRWQLARGPLEGIYEGAGSVEGATVRVLREAFPAIALVRFPPPYERSGGQAQEQPCAPSTPEEG